MRLRKKFTAALKHYSRHHSVSSNFEQLLNLVAMNTPDPLDNQDIKHLQSFIYLIPVVGFFPALWTLYRRDGNREQRNASRLSVVLALGWLLGYVLLGSSAQATESLNLLIMSSLLTSGYFLVNLWLMTRVWQRQSLSLPGTPAKGDRDFSTKKIRY
jgi:hypothetical protein